MGHGFLITTANILLLIVTWVMVCLGVSNILYIVVLKTIFRKKYHIR
jgi:hypothetical protein